MSDEERYKIEVPFSCVEILAWKEIDANMTKDVYQQISKYSIKYEVVCRFFDPKDSHFWLFLYMDVYPESDEERLRIYNVVLSEIVRRCNPCRHAHNIRDAMRELHSRHPKDVFLYDISSSKCPVDYLCQRYRYSLSTAERWYDLYLPLRQSILNVTIDSYPRVLRELASLLYFDTVIDNTVRTVWFVPRTRRRLAYHYSSYAYDLLWHLGLGALSGEYDWDSDSETLLQRIGRLFISPYTIRGPDEDGDMRTVVRRGSMRPLVGELVRLRIASAVLDLCLLYKCCYRITPQLSRLLSILESMNLPH